MNKGWIIFVGSLLFPLSIQATEGVSTGAEWAKQEEGATEKPTIGIIANLLESHDNPFTLYPYDTNYLLYTRTNVLNQEAIKAYSWAEHIRNDEIKFQISFAFPIVRGIAGDNSVLGASYTQRAWWQALNRVASSPFRETNYEPQLFIGWATEYNLGDWTLHDIEFGLNHQSNGRAEPTSRGWNRAYARLMAQNGNFQVQLRPWYRIPHSNDNEKDNPDITKYMGHYDLQLGYRLGAAVLSMRGRYNWNTGYGGAEFGLSYGLTKQLRLYTQVFTGYGESMIDYNFKQTRVGIGIMINDIL